MNEHVDVAGMGMGPGGGVASSKLLTAGKRVAVIERAHQRRVRLLALYSPQDRAATTGGGHPGRPGRRGGRGAAGLADRASVPRLGDPHLDDSGHVDGYNKQGALVLKGEAHISGPGRISVGGRELSAEHLVNPTGSEAVAPPIDGPDEIVVWPTARPTPLQTCRAGR